MHGDGDAAAAPLVVADAATDPRVRALPPVVSGQVGAYLGVPLVADDGTAVGALCVFDPSARAWTRGRRGAAAAAGGVGGGRARAVRAGRRARDRAAAVGAGRRRRRHRHLRLGPRHRQLRWDDRLLELFGYDRETFGGTHRRVQRPAAPRRPAAGRARRCRGDRQLRRLRRGVPRRAPRRRAPAGSTPAGGPCAAPTAPPSALLGAALRHHRAHEQRGAGRARCSSRCRPRSTRLDRAWRFTYVNAEAERLLGRAREELLGGGIWELFPAAVGIGLRDAATDRACAPGEPVTFEAYYPAPLDGWYEVRAWPTPDGPVGVLPRHHRRRRGAGAAERGGRAAARCARVSASSPSTLDVEEAVARLARLVVPALGRLVHRHPGRRDQQADWRRRLRDVGCWHADPALRAPCRALPRRAARRADRRPLLLAGRCATGRRRDPARRRPADRSACSPPRAGRATLCARSRRQPASCCRCAARGRTVGAAHPLRGAERGAARPTDDLATRGEVAGRAGLALDNARLYGQQRELAEGLQRSLLTDAARARPRCRSRALRARRRGRAGRRRLVRRVPAARRRDVLVIGDVVGHDTDAAAAMGQVRTLLRGIAVHDAATARPSVLRRRGRRPCDPAGRHHRHRRRRPGRADAGRARPRRHPPALVQRRAPAALLVTRRRHGAALPDARGRPAARRRPGTRAPRTRSTLERGVDGAALHRRPGRAPRAVPRRGPRPAARRRWPSWREPRPSTSSATSCCERLLPATPRGRRRPGRGPAAPAGPAASSGGGPNVVPEGLPPACPVADGGARHPARR